MKRIIYTIFGTVVLVFSVHLLVVRQIALRSLRTGDYNKAVHCFQYLTNFGFRDGVGLYFAQAKVREANGMIDSALLDITRALTMRPTSEVLRVERARLLAILARSDEALLEINKAIESAPQFGPAYRVRGMIWGALGEPSNAVMDWEKAEALGHGDGFLNVMKANALLDMGKTNEAGRELTIVKSKIGNTTNAFILHVVERYSNIIYGGREGQP